MIPKIIHYCWFSKDKKPKTIQRCIDSWRKKLPDYTIKCWDGNSFDFDSIAYTREALQCKQYPAAADYVRLYALYTDGGIYLDSDVLVLNSFNDLLNNIFFTGTETYGQTNNRHYRIESAIIGSEKGHPFVKDCMHYYETNNFIRADGIWDNRLIVMPTVMSRIAEKYGYEYKNQLQHIKAGITIYPTSVFANSLFHDYIDPTKIYAVHQNAGSWIDYSDRGWLFRFCKKNDLMGLYHRIEKIRHLNR